MLKKLSRMMASGNDKNFQCRKKTPYLKGAMFSVPSAAILDTKATGRGTIPLIIEVGSADIMASLIEFKKDFAEQDGDSIKLTFAGASEAHLLAKEIGEAGIGVLLTRPRPFPAVWEQRRM